MLPPMYIDGLMAEHNALWCTCRSGREQQDSRLLRLIGKDGLRDSSCIRRAERNRAEDRVLVDLDVDVFDVFTRGCGIADRGRS